VPSEFAVFVEDPNSKAIVHTTVCSYYLGSDRQPRRHCHWLSGFTNPDEALSAARQAEKETVRWCRSCEPGRGTFQGTQDAVLASTDPLVDIHVPGSPSPFRNAPHDTIWRQALSSALPPVRPGVDPDGLAIDFTLAQGRAFGQDLDNLWDPVFSVLVRQKGWFGGHRPNVSWFRATKGIGQEPGAHVRLFSGLPLHGLRSSQLPCFDGTYEDPPPSSARDEPFAGWCRSLALSVRGASLYAVRLSFGLGRINIAQVAGGSVKNILDGLYPVLGGRPGAPDDWRIVSLEAVKNDTGIANGAVRIRVWPAPAGA